MLWVCGVSLSNLTVRLRRLGLIRYSRKFIDVYVLAMRDHLKHQGMSIPRTTEEMAQRAGG